MTLRAATEGAPGDLVWEWTFELPAPPERVWPLVSDTQRINRAIGLPSWRFVETPDPLGGSRRTGSFLFMGKTIEWEEHPYEWVAPREMGVERLYTRGPLRALRSHVRLEPSAGGTRLVHRIAVTPKGIAGGMIARLEIGRNARAGFTRVYGQIARHVGGLVPDPYPPDPPRLAAHGPGLLRRGEQALLERGVEPALARALVEHLGGAPDREVLRLRPYALARRWGAPRVAALRLLLFATRAGLVELTWDVVCPSCRGAKERATDLARLAEEAHCPSCNVRFDATFDRSVEVTFRPSPAVRTLEAGEYCVGGPGNTRHVLAQRRLVPGSRAEVALSLEPGDYRVRGPRSAGQATLTVEARPSAGPDGVSPGEAAVDVTLTRAGVVSAPAVVAAGPIALRLQNPDDVEQVALLERTAWTEDVATARDVTCLQEFRDLFASQVLRPSTRLAVGGVTLVFTDLKSSTAMYQQVGDAPAFALVRDHFDALFAAVKAEEGGVVKTIGDAVMAAFVSPAQGLRAAFDMHARIAALNATGRHPVPIALKVGVHTGPCLVVNQDDHLDYFGTTVNLAARIQGESEGDDVVVTSDFLTEPGVAEVLATHAPRQAPYEAALKGLTGSYRLVRLWPARAAAPLPVG